MLTINFLIVKQIQVGFFCVRSIEHEKRGNFFPPTPELHNCKQNPGISMPDDADPDYAMYIPLIQDPYPMEIDYYDEEQEDEDDDTAAAGTQNVMFPGPAAGRVLEGSGATTTASSQDGLSYREYQGFRDAPEARDQPSPKKSKRGEATPLKDAKWENPGEGDWHRDELDGLFCPICLEAWTSGDDHQVCCIPCGHIYGMSCIKRWLKQCGSPGKCPQCNMKCTLEDIRVLYASRIVVVDGELQKKVQSLESKCTSLEKKNLIWSKKEKGWQKREADLSMQIQNLREKATYLEGLLENMSIVQSGLPYTSQDCKGQPLSEFGHQECPNGFLLQTDLHIEGARFFDVDVHSQTTMVARRLSGLAGPYELTKISLLAPHERENIQLPLSTRVIKDLRVSPHAKLALLASLGKKLYVLSTESNNTIVTYDLPTAAWSCTWDLNNSNYVYAGLQNGMVLEFDLRQTLRPVESMIGLTSNPIHTVLSLSADFAVNSGIRSVLTASSVGLCHWNFGCSEEKSFLIPESMNEGVCISLAYGPKCGDIVASFRPRVETAGVNLSPSLSTPSASLLGQGVQGSHVLYKRVGSAQRYHKLRSTSASVNDIRLPKSAVVDRVNLKSLYAAGDEVTGDLVLQQLPCLVDVQRLKSRKCVRDVKYSQILNSELLSCLSEDTLQLFSSKMS
ncbi:uncharacterized protein [Coffea arabica]|uniref:RING-type E3 ubiquitin transferase n=1 Tax=Coffea arabica TaxID=13443 RepID=A0A6P6T1L6_COFAR|nr:uncharacterized protein LOC113697006 isoform X2 [Coffea arabica]